MKIELEAADLQEMRDLVMGCIDFEPTDAQLREAVDQNTTEGSSLLGLIIAWGWHDTEVRDQLCAALDQLPRTEAQG